MNYRLAFWIMFTAFAAVSYLYGYHPHTRYVVLGDSVASVYSAPGLIEQNTE